MAKNIDNRCKECYNDIAAVLKNAKEILKMGRPQKEKNNYEERFTELFEEEKIEGNAHLLRKMYTAYYKGKPGIDSNMQIWVNSQLPDFGKKLKGERTFTESDIKAIERALGKSWVDIVEPLPKKSRKRVFNNTSLRYAAYMDEERYYQDLIENKDVDGYDPILLNYDEYGKTILDYIIEEKAENGLRFLIDRGFLKCDPYLSFGGYIYRAEKFSEEIWDWIISIDDAEFFLKALGEQNLFDFRPYHDEKTEKFLEKIIGTNRIFKALCNEQVNPNNNFKYMPSLLFDAFKFALNKNNQTVSQIIISSYTKFIESQIAEAQKKSNQNISRYFNVRQSNFSQHEIRYGESLIMYVWSFAGFHENFNGFEEQIEPLQTSNIINRLVVKNLSAMVYGDSFVKDGIYYIKKEPDISLEALIYLTKEKDCKFLPTYIGEESGVTKICAYNSCSNTSLKELGEMLGEIHALSQEKLGENRVYMYSRGFANNYCFGYTIERGTKVIGSWQICDIGTPISDIIGAFLNYCKLRNQHGESYRYFIEGKNKLYEELSGFLHAYPNKRVIENFGGKFNEEIDRRLKDAIQDKNAIDIEIISIAKSFAEIYRDDLNSITKCTSHI